MKFGNKILEYKDELLKDLNTLIGFESVATEKPEECSKALEFILKRAEDFGLCSEMVTDISGHITLGDGEKLCGVLTHLDVVPAGNGWSKKPFALTDEDGRLYGRGIADDKGAALVALYCLRALKESGTEGRNTLRAIYGTTEECGMADMEGYFEKMPLPDYSFTPDSDYGICYGEKGILQLKVSTPINDATMVSQLHSGTVVNAVPDLAYAIVDSSNYEEQTLTRLAYASSEKYEIRYTIDGLMLVCRGNAAHACEPDKGKNAALSLVDLLADAYDDKAIGSICSFINYCVNRETNGRSLGLKMSDAASGALTVNLGSVHIEEEIAEASFDIRYPVTVSGDFVLEQFKKVAENFNLKVDIIHHEAPLYVAKDSALVEMLSESYEAVTGEKPELYTAGGGTYARHLGGKGVAFGPAFADDEVNMHNADESIDKEKFFVHAQICLEAMYNMFTKEL